MTATDAILAALASMGAVVLGTLPGAVAFGVVFAVLCAWFPCNPGKPWWRKTELLTDLCWWFVVPLLGRYMSIALLVVGFVLVGAAVGSEYGMGSGPLASLPFWAQVVAYFAISDLLLYATHRMFHGRSLWRYHAIHHSSEELDWISAPRFHPVDQFLHLIVPDAVVILLGAPPEVMAFVAPFQAWHSGLIHANLNWDFGPFRYVLVSPVYHRWHHTDVARGGEKNYAATFPIFDVAFGTAYMPRGVLPDGYGVDDPHFPKGFGEQLLYPWRKSPAEAPAQAADVERAA